MTVAPDLLPILIETAQYAAMSDGMRFTAPIRTVARYRDASAHRRAATRSSRTASRVGPSATAGLTAAYIAGTSPNSTSIFLGESECFGYVTVTVRLR